MHIKYLGLLLLSPLLLLSGCGNEGDKAKELSLLDRVPATTPYVFYNEKPLPEKISAKLLASLSTDLSHFSQAFEEQINKGVVKGSAVEFIEAILKEFDGKLSPEGLDSLGFKSGAKSVFYGLNLYPVLITEINDPKKVEATIERVLLKGKIAPTKGDISGHTYWRFESNSIVNVVLITEKYFISSLLPLKEEKAYLVQILAEKYQGESLADSGDFDQLKSQYGYTGQGEGFIDFENLSQHVFNQFDATNEKDLKSLNPDFTKPSESCQALTTSLIEKAPRLVMGTVQAEANTIAVQMLFETAPEVAAQLAKLAAPVPGLGADIDAAFSMGFSMNAVELRNALTDALRFVINQNKGCEWVDTAKLEGTIFQLNLVLNPLVSSIKGLDLQLNGLNIDEDSNVKGIDLSLLIAADDPRGLFALIQTFVPSFSSVEMKTDGSVVELPVAALGKDIPPVYVAMKDQALAFSTGLNNEAILKNILTAPIYKPWPLFSFSYNLAKIADYLKKLDAIMGKVDVQDERQKMLREQLSQMNFEGGVINRLRVNVSANEHGLVVDQIMKLK